MTDRTGIHTASCLRGALILFAAGGWLLLPWLPPLTHDDRSEQRDLGKGMSAVLAALIHYTTDHGGPPPDLETLDHSYPDDLAGLIAELQRHHNLVWLDHHPTADGSCVVLRAHLRDGRAMVAYGDGRIAVLANQQPRTSTRTPGRQPPE